MNSLLLKCLTGLFFVSIFSIGNPNYSVAQKEEDTTWVNAHDETHWYTYGAYDSWAEFPSKDNSYRKIMLEYTLGCPGTDSVSECSQWDYTTKIEAMLPTGTYDSNVVPAPNFRVDGDTVSTIYYNTDPTYINVYDDENNSTDSVKADSFKITLFNDSQNPLQATDSMYVYPGNYYRYEFNSNGDTIGSKKVGYEKVKNLSLDTVYEKYEVKEGIELARASTPYAGNKEHGWYHTWRYDVTEYAPILHDSVEIRAFYRGPRNGFTVSVDFAFIEGTPPREPKRVMNLWKSPANGWIYGDSDQPISDHLKTRNIDLNQDEKNYMIRVVPNGHGFGPQAENCAEFCQKNYYIDINKTERFKQLIWRDDCGMTPIYPQTGTWIYSRSNWCPGTPVTRFDHEATPYIDPGSSFTVDMAFDPYTFLYENANTTPKWVLDVQLITFGEKNFENDASLNKIIAPNTNENFKRYNPICKNPLVVIRNKGSKPLTSVDIDYGGINAPDTLKGSYTWEGNLEFGELDTVALPGTDKYGGLYVNSERFNVDLSNPNGKEDENPNNDHKTVSYEKPPELPEKFIFEIQSDAPKETSWKITDKWGNTIQTSKPYTEANKLYRDTISLEPGCYEMLINDSENDGVNFFCQSSNASNSGCGTIKLRNHDNQFSLVNLQDNFGDRLSIHFTVGHVLDVEESNFSPHLNVYPNPAQSKLNLEGSFTKGGDFEVEVTSIMGQQVMAKTFDNYSNQEVQLNIGELKAGIYLIKAQIGDKKVIKRFVKQ